MKKIRKGERIGVIIPSEAVKSSIQKEVDVPTGIKAVDCLIGGLKFGELVVVGARPAMGKTKFLLRTLKSISKDVSVLFLSLENNQRKVANKLISLEKDGGESFFVDHLEKGNYASDLVHQDLFISDTIFDSIEEYLLLIVHHIVQDGVQVIAIDYLQLLPASQGRVSILEMLKGICDLFLVTIIVTSRVSPDCELRGGDKKPRLNDLTIEPSQRCLLDVVLMLYRPEYYGFLQDEWGNSTSGRLEVIIAKDREKEPFDQTVDCLFTPKLDNQESH